MNLNIMMDPKPLFPQMYHPRSDRKTVDFSRKAKYYTRTARPTKYFFIDFGLSRKYEPGDMPPVEVPIHGGDKTVPEFAYSYDPVDPFPTDINVSLLSQGPRTENGKYPLFSRYLSRALLVDEIFVCH